MRSSSVRGNWVVSGDYVIEVARDLNNLGQEILFDAHTDKPLPDSCQKLSIKDDWVEIFILFTSRGYYDPGCMYLRNGDPGYPPESGDERTFDEAWMWFYNNECKLAKKERIDQKLGQDLFDHYYGQIMDTELEFPEEPDRDDY